MGFTNRFSTLLKQKVNTLLDKYEDPKEALDYSYIQQVETLNRLRRNIAEVVTAKKRLEMQKMRQQLKEPVPPNQLLEIAEQQISGPTSLSSGPPGRSTG